MSVLRLGILEHGQPFPKRLLLWAIESLGRVRADDVLRTSLYRPQFFGGPFLRFGRSLLRGRSEWTPGERELIAAFVSRQNSCPYCVGVHTQTATLGLARPIDVALLDGWRAAKLDARVASIFELLEVRAQDAQDITRERLDRARSAGVSDEAIVDALHVAFMFDIINRLANAFGFTTVNEAGRLKTAGVLHRIGYRVPDFLLR